MFHNYNMNFLNFIANGREEKISTTDKSPSVIMQEVINIATISAAR